ncbi:MAG: 50S ribosomal protein L9 [Clostridia bacterium]|nr:50S ribosomal protein L9 [Clostridia bacterium]
MKVILTQDVKSQGKKGDVITVSDGYGFNYLLKNKLAVIADAQALNEAKNREASKQHKIEVEKAEAKAVAEKLAASVVKLELPGTEDRLYGSVTAKDIAEALAAQHSVEIDKRKIVMGEQIRTYGTYTLDVKLYTEITGKINLVVSKK